MSTTSVEGGLVRVSIKFDYGRSCEVAIPFHVDDTDQVDCLDALNEAYGRIRDISE